MLPKKGVRYHIQMCMAEHKSLMGWWEGKQDRLFHNFLVRAGFKILMQKWAVRWKTSLRGQE